MVAADAAHTRTAVVHTVNRKTNQREKETKKNLQT